MEERYVNRGGREINPEVLEAYEIVDIEQYDPETGIVTILVERRSPRPVVGAAIIIVFSLCMIAMAIWFVISLMQF